MYEFVISKEVITLFLSHPRTPLPLSVKANQPPINEYENTLLLVICNNNDENDLYTKLNMMADIEVTNY